MEGDKRNECACQEKSKARDKKNSRKRKKKLLFRKNVKRDKYLLLMFAPVLIYYLIFAYLPMTGLVMAFTQFKAGSGMMGLYTGTFVGLKWFIQFF